MVNDPWARAGQVDIVEQARERVRAALATPESRMRNFGTTDIPCGYKDGPRKISALYFGRHPAFSRCKPIYPNRYPGVCAVCGRRIGPNQGYTQKRSNGTWAVFC